jgi:glycosyltransferase involved in cell wall biosynthesis
MIDFTRLLRRAGRVWTGVDRVELAYLQALLADPVPLWGLARTPLGYVVLDQAGLAEFYRRLTDEEQATSPDFLAHLQRGAHPLARSALTDARRLATARILPPFLARKLQRVLPAGTAYFNIGHSNLTTRVLSAVRSVPSSRIVVFVHDVIPLDYPQYQRAGTVEVFEQKMRRVRRFADLIVYNSEDTEKRTVQAMAPWGAVPPGIVAHLGTTGHAPDPAKLPAGLPPEDLYFISVGTIEPRKNHLLLLNIWERLGPRAPLLLICGSRGWNNEAVFARLDALGPDARVREVTGVEDAGLAALVAGAHAMLFPSHAEGYGLPAVEALQAGTPLLCSNMETFREILAKNAVYIDASADELWEKQIVEWSEQARDTLRVSGFEAPTWDAHFKIVLTLT